MGLDDILIARAFNQIKINGLKDWTEIWWLDIFWGLSSGGKVQLHVSPGENWKHQHQKNVKNINFEKHSVILVWFSQKETLLV